ncbi:MAG: type ISP restriction/modification enzyme [Thermoanaerobaculia bacterium]
MPKLIAPWEADRVAGSWRLELRFQASRDEEADYSHFRPSLPWLRELGSREQGALCEDLRREGVALISCDGPEEAFRLLSEVCGRTVTARVLEPDGTEFRPGEGRTERERGVYATPRALTRFVVRCVDTLLRSPLDLEGLADRAVRLLDPAAGPANFILEAYRRAVAHHRRAQGRAGVETLLEEHLVPHFQGLEILPGAWAAGQRALRNWMEQMGERRSHSAARPASPERFPLLLADALSSPNLGCRASGFLGEEADAAFRLRTGESFSVVLGNPPFRGRSANTGSWIQDLLRGYVLADGRQDQGYFTLDGHTLGERNLKWLQDDYVKFLRLAQWLIDRNGRGVVGFVVNHNCLEAPTFRGLRRSLLGTFDQIYALDLHGNQRRRETGPEGQRDENVFEGIAQGVAVLFLVKGPTARKGVYRADLYGSRREKLRTLAGAKLESLPWSACEPHVPRYLFRTSDREREREFQRGVALDEIFRVHSLGVVTGRDARVLAFQREDFEPALLLAGRAPERRSVARFLYRPFDLRHLLYGADLERPRTAVMSHLRGRGNLGLLALRHSTAETGAFVTRWVTGHKVVNPYAPNSVFPLFLYQEDGRAVANLHPGIQRNLAELLGELPAPEDVFGYVYSVLHDARYLSRFREQLRGGFPRIPLPETRERFQRWAALGRELCSLHLLEDVRLVSSPVLLEGEPGSDRTIDKAALSYDETGGRVRLNRRGLHFEGISPEVWQWQVGSYRVLERWLRARAGHVLSLNAIREFRWIAEAVRLSVELQHRLQTSGR